MIGHKKILDFSGAGDSAAVDFGPDPSPGQPADFMLQVYFQPGTGTQTFQLVIYAKIAPDTDVPHVPILQVGVSDLSPGTGADGTAIFALPPYPHLRLAVFDSSHASNRVRVWIQ